MGMIPKGKRISRFLADLPNNVQEPLPVDGIVDAVFSNSPDTVLVEVMWDDKTFLIFLLKFLRLFTYKPITGNNF